MSSGDFKKDQKKYKSRARSPRNDQLMIRESGSGDLISLRPEPAPVPLEAYLACALTGRSKEEEAVLEAVTEVVRQVCRETDIDLYEPAKFSHPDQHAEMTASDVFHLDKGRVARADLLIHLTHFPSTGVGEELDIALNALVPVLQVRHAKTRVSRMVLGIPSLQVEATYKDVDELQEQLLANIIKIRPLLEERKLAFSEYDANVVGDRVRILRESAGLTRAEVANTVPGLTEEWLRRIEESTDKHSNPSLLHLRQIAATLRTTVADLVEPDLSDRLSSMLQEWLEGKQAARFGIDPRDRNRILRRLLLRMIDSLESDEPTQP